MIANGTPTFSLPGHDPMARVARQMARQDQWDAAMQRATERAAQRAAAVIPDCTAGGFVGTGQRCSACRIHRNNHA